MGKVPKGVQGQSLGAGAKRAKTGKGCAGAALLILGTGVGTLAAIGYGATEAVKAVLS